MTLERNPSVAGGYLWSSGDGPHIEIHSGTVCDGEIVVGDTPPIAFVVPFVRRLILGESDVVAQP